MLPLLSKGLLRSVILAVLVAEIATATGGCKIQSTKPKVQSGKACGIKWDRSGDSHGGGGSGGGDGGSGGGRGGGGFNGGGRKDYNPGDDTPVPINPTPELPPNNVGGGPPPGPSSTETVDGGPPTPLTPEAETSTTPVPSGTPEGPQDEEEDEETEAVEGGAPPDTPAETPPSTALAGSHSDSSSDSVTDITNINNEETNIINTTGDLQQWTNTSITLMISLDYKRVEVADIAINVDISAQNGEYEVPQAPWLSCVGESFYYRFTSSSGTVQFSEEFTIEGTDTDLTKSCVEEKAAPKLVQSPKGHEWKALNSQSFGYTIIQNVTNIFNQIVTTIINGEVVTKTVTAEGATVTGAGATATKLVTVTNVVTEGGATITSVITGASPAISPDAISPDAISPDAISPTAMMPGGAEGGAVAPTPTSGSGSGGSAEPEDEDDEWDDGDMGDSPSGTVSMSSGSASASATSGTGFDDDWEGFGAASGRPHASLAVALISSLLATLAGTFLMVA